MNCLHCGVEIKPPRRKFCCANHKNIYNQKHLYNNKYKNKYRSKGPENFMKQLLSYKKRNEFLTIDFLLELFEAQAGRCAISGALMTYQTSGGKCPSNISLDRIDSSKGYQKENIQLVCSLVNTMKMQYSTDELVHWCKLIVDHQRKP